MEQCPKKQKNIEPGSPNWTEEGDAWIYTCIKRSTYLFVAFSVGKWTQESCGRMMKKVSYYHDRLGKTKYNVLVTDDAFQEISKYAEKVNKFLEKVFRSLNLTLNDIETIQICGIFGSLIYQQTVYPSEAKNFDSGKCKSFESFEKGSMQKCPYTNNCGAHARVFEQRAADK